MLIYLDVLPGIEHIMFTTGRWKRFRVTVFILGNLDLKYKSSHLYEPHREKTYLLTCASNEDSNQPRIRAVWSESSLSAWRNCIFGFPKCAQWLLWSDCVNAQTDLNIRGAHMFEGAFSRVVAHIACIWVTASERFLQTCGQGVSRPVCTSVHSDQGLCCSFTE